MGDDKSDETMFEMLRQRAGGEGFPKHFAQFSCTVGKKPSIADYFVHDVNDVEGVINASPSLNPQRSGALAEPDERG